MINHCIIFLNLKPPTPTNGTGCHDLYRQAEKQQGLPHHVPSVRGCKVSLMIAFYVWAMWHHAVHVGAISQDGGPGPRTLVDKIPPVNEVHRKSQVCADISCVSSNRTRSRIYTTKNGACKKKKEVCFGALCCCLSTSHCYCRLNIKHLEDIWGASHKKGTKKERKLTRMKLLEGVLRAFLHVWMMTCALEFGQFMLGAEWSIFDGWAFLGRACCMNPMHLISLSTW